MKCLYCENPAVGCQKIEQSKPKIGEFKSKSGYSFNLYLCKIHLKKQLDSWNIEIDESDDNKN